MANSGLPNFRRLVVALRRGHHGRLRRPPDIRSGGASDGTRRIFYLSPEPRTPRGGVRVLYRHVDLLNELGFDAAIVHRKKGYRAAWFDNRTRIVPNSVLEVASRDIVVVPEFYVPQLRPLPADVGLVVFNQGAYHTFDSVPLESVDTFLPADVAAILTVSDDSAALLRFTFPELSVQVAHTVIDATVFYPPPESSVPNRRIAYTTSRREQERHQLLSILRRRGLLDGWELVPIAGMPETEVGEVLRSCPIFLSFSEREGFGLPPAEAMACGCYVVGYDGRGGAEFFDPTYSTPVPDSALITFAQSVEAAMRRFESSPRELLAAGRAASVAVLHRYSVDTLKADLTEFFSELGATRAAA